MDSLLPIGLPALNLALPAPPTAGVNIAVPQGAGAEANSFLSLLEQSSSMLPPATPSVATAVAEDPGLPVKSLLSLLQQNSPVGDAKLPSTPTDRALKNKGLSALIVSPASVPAAPLDNLPLPLKLSLNIFGPPRDFKTARFQKSATDSADDVVQAAVLPAVAPPAAQVITPVSSGAVEPAPVMAALPKAPAIAIDSEAHPTDRNVKIDAPAVETAAPSELAFALRLETAASPAPILTPAEPSLPTQPVRVTVDQRVTPESIVPESIAQTIVLPRDIAPQAIAPQATAPQAIAPESTVPQTAAPQAAVPQVTLPQTTVPETTVPQATAPQATVPQAAAPQATVPQAAAPQATAPDTVSQTTGDKQPAPALIPSRPNPTTAEQATPLANKPSPSGTAAVPVQPTQARQDTRRDDSSHDNHRPAPDPEQPAPPPSQMPAPAPSPMTTAAAGVFEHAAVPAPPAASAPSAPATPIAPHRDEPVKTGPANQISFSVATGDQQKVEVRLMDRAGEVRVSVRAPNEELAGTLRQDIGSLTGKLNQSGYSTEAFTPSRGSGEFSRDPRNTDPQQQTGGDRQNSGRDQQQQSPQEEGRGKRPAWLDELENSMPTSPARKDKKTS